jgi:hypothetical protein
MKLSAEQIQSNWSNLLKGIEENVSSPRKEKLLSFYKQYEDRLMLLPASHKKEYHNAFPGGYVDHVLRVIECAFKLNDVWTEMGVDTSTYTKEELYFSSLNHDLGKMGDEENESYIPQTDKWRQEKLGEDYMFNKNLAFASVPDRSLFLLQSHGVSYTFNEMIAIQTHDGLYDEGNKKYLMGYLVEQKPRTSLLFIVHQADMMAARIEFEQEWLKTFNSNSPQPKPLKKPVTKSERANAQLKSIGGKNPSMNSVIDKFFV